jgi:hypothetical protein
MKDKQLSVLVVMREKRKGGVEGGRRRELIMQK